jgi:hypothetical protein
MIVSIENAADSSDISIVVLACSQHQLHSRNTHAFEFGHHFCREHFIPGPFHPS